LTAAFDGRSNHRLGFHAADRTWMAPGALQADTSSWDDVDQAGGTQCGWGSMSNVPNTTRSTVPTSSIGFTRQFVH
jgi:hypothetical protein